MNYNQGEELSKLRKSRISESFNSTSIEKSSGEGSRGGKIYGHDKDGNPIYEEHIKKTLHLKPNYSKYTHKPEHDTDKILITPENNKVMGHVYNMGVHHLPFEYKQSSKHVVEGGINEHIAKEINSTFGGISKHQIKDAIDKKLNDYQKRYDNSKGNATSTESNPDGYSLEHPDTVKDSLHKTYKEATGEDYEPKPKSTTLGTTKSGKDIDSNSNGFDREDYTKQDHIDAFNIHSNKANENKDNSLLYNKHSKIASTHHQQASK